MSGAPTPQIIFEPIAADAAPANITSPMPDAAPGGNAASVQQGFPAITMISELAGGKPPLGQDMNGFLNLLSGHAFFLQCGQFWPYSSTLASEISGYNAGAILEMADGTGLWLNTVASNTSNPDSGGAGWVPLSAYGVTSAGAVGGTLTLSAAQARYPIVIISGALTSNLVVQVPNRLGRWLFVNATTGAFALTVRTTSNLAGVNVPSGGGLASPVEVYCIGDGNIYPTVTPLAVAIDQAPTPLTLAERTNAGYLLATYFNQNSNLEIPAVGAVIVQNTAADGFFRKIPLPDFLEQVFTSTGGGGGVCINLGPFKLQGGSCNPSGGSVAVTFPEPFTSFVFPGAISVAGGPVQTWIPTGTLTLTGMRVANSGGSSFWLAFGE